MVVIKIKQSNLGTWDEACLPADIQYVLAIIISLIIREEHTK